MTNAWNRTGRLSFKNLGDRTLAPCWSLAGSSKRNDDIDSNYKNETYREDIFMAFSSKLGTTVETTTEEITILVNISSGSIINELVWPFTTCACPVVIYWDEPLWYSQRQLTCIDFV